MFLDRFRSAQAVQYGVQFARGVLRLFARQTGVHEQLPLTSQRPVSRPPSGSEALLDAHGVAQRLGVTTAWVYAETRADRIPHISIGRY